jgi:hypothetical protein
MRSIRKTGQSKGKRQLQKPELAQCARCGTWVNKSEMEERPDGPICWFCQRDEEGAIADYDMGG